MATISAVEYGKEFGFIGLYIVAPAYRGRGRGCGIKLWNHAVAYLHDRNIGLDVSAANPAAAALARSYDMEVVFETARMYTHRPPDIPHEKLYGITSFELG